MPRSVRFFTLLLLCLPAVATLLYVRAFAIELPYMDDWDIAIPQLPHLAAGQLSWSDVNVQHTESVIIFPQLVMLLAARLAGYHVLVTVYISYLFLCGSLYLLFLSFRRLNLPGRWSDLGFLPVSILFLGWGQWEGLLWSTHLLNTMALFFSLLALHFCVRAGHSPRHLAAAMTSAWIASFSMSSGLLVWFAALIYLAILAPFATRGQRLRYTAAWAVCGLACGICFTLDRAPWPTEWPTGVGYVLANPGDAVLYTLNYLGAPFSDGESAAVFGALLLLTAIVTVYLNVRKTRRQEGAARALLLVALVAIAIGPLLIRRLGLGTFQAYSSRYVTLASLAPIGVYFCVLTLLPRTPVARYLMGPLMVLFVWGMINSYRGGLMAARDSLADKTDCAEAVRNFRSGNPEDLKCAYPTPQNVIDRAAFLERQHWSLFR